MEERDRLGRPVIKLPGELDANCVKSVGELYERVVINPARRIGRSIIQTGN